MISRSREAGWELFSVIQTLYDETFEHGCNNDKAKKGVVRCNVLQWADLISFGDLLNVKV